jgi:hypothetical protein
MAELEMCDRWGISHSHFLGGSPAWTDLDREKAFAYRDHARELCSGCGTRAIEWDPDRGGDRLAYLSDSWRCLGCEAIAMEQDNIPSEEKGIKVGLVPNPELVSHG